MSQLANIFGEVIYARTRQQALIDGDQYKLVDDLAVLARQAGYKYPVYVTSGVWNLVEMAVANKKHCNDTTGVMWDILYMSIKASTPIDRRTSRFQVIITGTGRKRYHEMIAECGPTDLHDPTPCITIRLPNED